jgi:prepilin-type N-terminal cleavage/methylation domain-containing protein/prepilin-type processing-associated H-X9-DG protein
MNRCTFRERTSADRRRASRSRGLSLVEVMVVLAVICALVAISLPAVQSSRERARQMTCTHNLKQIGIAAQAHETFHRAFPYTSTTFMSNSQSQPAISPHIALLNSIDPPVYGRLDLQDATGNFPDASPASAKNRALFRHTITVFRCPSDRVPPGGNSYRANLGISPNNYSTGLSQDAQACKGAFVHNEAVRASTFSDGLSNTAFFSERVVGDGNRSHYDAFRDRFEDPADGQYAADFVIHCRNYAVATPSVHDSFSGYTWIFGGWLHTWYNHILTPNSTTPDCAAGVLGCRGGCPGAYSARSLHAGGVNLLFADGAVNVISNHVDVTVWHDMGTRNGQETHSLP